jgi:endonuclease/exonuclease/phosphatase family metal-dependent hydrolase
MIKLNWILPLSVSAFVFLGLAFMLWASAGESWREAKQGFPIQGSATADRPASLRVMTFNIAYCRGPRDDKGDLRVKQDIEAYLGRVAEAIKGYRPDIVAVQEVDFDSARSHHVDEAVELARLTGMNVACVPTWEKNYVAWPYWPPSQHYGRVRSGQCVLSRFPITANTRYALPQPEANPWWYNAYYFKRAVQIVDIALGQDKVRVFNVHLEAFGNENRMEQARVLVDLFGHTNTGRDLLLGDFNSVPPEAAKKSGFSDEPETDFTGDDTIATVRAQTGLSEVPAGPTFPSELPSRQLDYVFHAGMRLASGGVRTEATGVSDHLPVVAEFNL